MICAALAAFAVHAQPSSYAFLHLLTNAAAQSGAVRSCAVRKSVDVLIHAALATLQPRRTHVLLLGAETTPSANAGVPGRQSRCLLLSPGRREQKVLHSYARRRSGMTIALWLYEHFYGQQC